MSVTPADKKPSSPAPKPGAAQSVQPKASGKGGLPSSAASKAKSGIKPTASGASVMAAKPIPRAPTSGTTPNKPKAAVSAGPAPKPFILKNGQYVANPAYKASRSSAQGSGGTQPTAKKAAGSPAITTKQPARQPSIASPLRQAIATFPDKTVRESLYGLSAVLEAYKKVDLRGAAEIKTQVDRLLKDPHVSAEQVQRLARSLFVRGDAVVNSRGITQPNASSDPIAFRRDALKNYNAYVGLGKNNVIPGVGNFYGSTQPIKSSPENARLATILGGFAIGGIGGNGKKSSVIGTAKTQALHPKVSPDNKKNINVSTKNTKATIQIGQTTNAAPVPGTVQSRINIANGPTRFTPMRQSGNRASAGWEHVVSGHFNRPPANNRSVFTISEPEVKSILSSPVVVRSPVRPSTTMPGSYVREVDVGRQIGLTTLRDGGVPTSRIRVYTDSKGNLITTHPIK